MIRRLYDWTLSLSAHPRALWALAMVSFIESSFFPIPPDLLMIPMIIAAPRKAWLIALVATVSSVVGGLFGYFIGAVLFDAIGQPIFDFYGKSDAVAEFNAVFNEYGAMAVFVAGVTFLPYKVVTIMSGWAGLSIPVFIVASIAARALRFFIVAALLYKFGAPIRVFIEKYLGILFVLFVILLVGGFYALRYL
jgi:membrane protein YqaA with SNARE-associated domain